MPRNFLLISFFCLVAAFSVNAQSVSLESQNSNELAHTGQESAVLDQISTSIENDEFNYENLIGVNSEDLRNAFLDFKESEIKNNAIVSRANQTPEIARRILRLIESGRTNLSESESDAYIKFLTERNGELVFINNGDNVRALQETLDNAPNMGLPESRYRVSPSYAIDEIDQLAYQEIHFVRLALGYVKDMERGIVDFDELGAQFDLDPEYTDHHSVLHKLVSHSDHRSFYGDLEPKDPAFEVIQNRLAELREENRLDELKTVARISGDQVLRQGMKSPDVQILRKRLEILGYKPVNLRQEANVQSDALAILESIENTNISNDFPEVPSDFQPEAIVDPLVFDVGVKEAVVNFQAANGLLADGIVGPQTLRAINGGVSPEMTRLLIAMERLRWGPQSVEGRQLFVNIANFMAEVRDDNQKTFETVVVVGKTGLEYRTPEFHDEMEYIVINPRWYVPRSIAVRTYLPILKRGGSLKSSYKVLNSRGQVINTGNVNFSNYDKNNFPFRIIQENGPGNALGNVKFIFPNDYAIYLHDTPAKSLFSHTVRAHSHGCVRVRDPIDLATHLMTPYYENPRASYDSIRATGRETFVEMKTRIPVFLTYFTTYIDDEGSIQTAPDIYGRDPIVQRALKAQGLDI